ncbi:MAG: tetratricopeptide repeat protein [Rhodospirillaceae bacterium]|nr:tetratricopeptide repeat protein [Rhodospirillaceae bacterium]
MTASASMSETPDQKLRRALGLHQAGQLAPASALYREILALAPDHFDALYLLGAATTQSGDAATGLMYLDRALAIKADFASAHVQRGNALRRLGRNAEALLSFERALTIDAASIDARINRGIELKELGRCEEALADLDVAVAAAPDDAVAHYNRAAVLVRMGRDDTALAAFERAAALKPDFAEAHFGAAECRLARGEFAGGWAGFEWRWRTLVFSRSGREFTPSQWRGEGALAGKTILLHAEQGLGDTIQFCRYAPLLRERGARVVLEVQPKLKALIATLDPAVTVVARGEALPPFDLHCPLMSLPGAFKTELATIPARGPYLSADAARVTAWRERLPHDGVRIGLAWSGTASHGNDRNRSATLATLGVLAGPGRHLIGLQSDMTTADRAAAASLANFTSLGDQLTDFAEIAALVAALDVVVTVDTVFAHLAGALGKPVFVLLSKACDWRWLQGRADSPWYPSAKLFRQETLGDWSAPMRRLQSEVGRLFPGG